MKSSSRLSFEQRHALADNEVSTRFNRMTELGDVREYSAVYDATDDTVVIVARMKLKENAKQQFGFQ